MNQEYDNTNQGVLFTNREQKTDKHPNMRGSLNVDGVDYWISCWFKTSKKGEKYMSLAVTKKEDVDNAGMAQARKAATQDNFKEDADLPF